MREIDGGRILDSQGVLVANRRALMERPQQLLPVLHELLERLDAHLKAEQFYSGEPAVPLRCDLAIKCDLASRGLFLQHAGLSVVSSLHLGDVHGS